MPFAAGPRARRTNTGEPDIDVVRPRQSKHRDDVLPKAPISVSLIEIVEIFPIGNFLAGIDRLLAGTSLFEAGWLPYC
jgi:hypothetical protein